MFAKEKIKKIFKSLGPGLVTGASDDDPSGIATYSQAGAMFGLSTLWTSILAFPLMAGIQQMCARIGLVSRNGLAGTLKKNYPRPLLYIMLLFSAPAIVLNIASDIAGMGAVGNLLFPSIDSSVFSVFFTLGMIGLIIYLPYKKIAAILKWLCSVMLVYMIVPFFYKQDMQHILTSTFLPDIEWNKDYMLVLVGILGTTISPYLFFWQASMEVEEQRQNGDNIIVDKKLINEVNTDVDIGMLFSGAIMFFIILTTGTVLFDSGVHQIETVEQAAIALKPIAGDGAYLLFAIGIISTGLIAVPVLAGSLSYMFAETFDWDEGLDKKFHEAKGFYFIIIISLIVGLGINFVGISPIKALIYTAVLYGVTAPVLIAMILLIANNKVIMGKYTNGIWANFFGFLSFMIMLTSSISLLYFYWNS